MIATNGPASLALWGGVECTINRVQDRYVCQLTRSGHAIRMDDLERFAALGLRVLRYPILWERTAPDGLDSADWRWPDERMQRLRQLGIEPIVGLLHHGSGPAHTSLVDPSFCEQFVPYAAAVAARYPWVEHYTPINEPLTTARFSGLYGWWFPHGRDEKLFGRALLNQCRAIAMSMEAIRRINPRARLIQTDDLGKTYSTPLLGYQADFQNELRWLGWDLLSGRVDPRHALWHWLTRDCDCTPAQLGWFTEHPCEPDIIGLNYYVTSERFLDDQAQNYPEHCRGGNRRHEYADIEAARVLESPTLDVEARIAEAWQRYELPIAITEAHIDANREDQLRWLHEMWRGAEAAQRAGADVRAVTVWALLGAHDWNSLVTQVRGYYESGAFDLRSDPPRATAVATLAQELANGRTPAHPVLGSPGWWRRPHRFRAAPITLIAATDKTDRFDGPMRAPQPVLITGATGTLGRAFARICTARGLAHSVCAREALDIADPTSVERAFARHRPWAVVNAAGYVKVDEAERDPERCFRENTTGPAVLARACARHGVRMLTFSSDLVFDGELGHPYLETDKTSPLSVYGHSKEQAEQQVLERYPRALVIRTSAFFGPWDEHNFVAIVLRTLASGDAFNAASDLTVSPTYVPDLVHAALDLLIDGESGIWHLTNARPMTWVDLAAQAASAAGIDASRLEGCPSRELNYTARRPCFSALASMRGVLLPDLRDALNRYVAHAPERMNIASKSHHSMQ
jgi:dTDP-4-dehydrorhamnose reductase